MCDCIVDNYCEGPCTYVLLQLVGYNNYDQSGEKYATVHDQGHDVGAHHDRLDITVS